MQPVDQTSYDSLTTWRQMVGQTSPTIETRSVPSGFLTVMCGPKYIGDRKNPNPWYFKVTDVTCPHGSMYRNAPRFGEFRNTGTLSQVAISPSVDDMGACIAKAGQDALSNLLDSMSSADWGSNIAETAANFGNPVKQLTDLAESERWEQIKRDAKRKAKGRVRVYIQLLSAAWLQLQYVWKPLVSDIYGTAAALSQQMQSVTFVGRAIHGVKPSGGAVPILGSRVIEGPITGLTSARVKYVCNFRVNPLATAARLTSLDPAVIAWNLLPLSFVVDWVYNVGGYLQNMEAHARFGSAFVSGYATVTTLKDYQFSKTGKDTTGLWDCTVNAKFVEKSLSRSLLVALPTPTKPVLNASLNSGQLLNLAALLAQALK